MDELDIHSVNRGHELRQGIQLRLGLAPVVARSPVLHEILDLGQLHALGLVIDRLLVGPPCIRDAPAEVDECLFRNVDVEGADCVGVSRSSSGTCLVSYRWNDGGGERKQYNGCSRGETSP